jgi:uncharacterized membrane protein
MKYAIYCVSTLVVCAAVDFVWLTVMKDRLYAPVMGDMLTTRPRLPALSPSSSPAPSRPAET